MKLMRVVLYSPLILRDPDNRTQHPTDTHRRKDISRLSEREVIGSTEDEWHRGELQVQDGPGETYPEGEEEDDGLGEEHLYGAGEGGAEEGEDGAIKC